jgi:hypothetical protein
MNMRGRARTSPDQAGSPGTRDGGTRFLVHARVAAELMRESVVLRHARLWISNGHPASVVLKNQHFTIDKNQIATARLASNQVVGTSEFSRRICPQSARQLNN